MPWKTIGIVAGAIVSVLAVFGAIYKLDCFNIRAYGDTLFSTDTDIKVVMQKIDCQGAQYQFDRTQSEMWRIEARYRRNDGTLAPMTVPDRRRYNQLLGQMEKWKKWMEHLKCEPAKF